MISQALKLLSPVEAAAEQWWATVRKHLDVPKSSGLILPLAAGTGRLIDLERDLSRLPEVYRKHPAGTDPTSILDHYQRIVARVVGCHAGLSRVLSQLAMEAASFRVLIDPADSFDVSGAGVLNAVAFHNFVQLLVHWQRDAKAVAGDKALRRFVWWPLKLADRCCDSARPGDLWISDLSARTVRRACQKVTANFSHRVATEVFGPLMLEFVTRSSLSKLLEADQLGRKFAAQAQYSHWPGLGILMTAPDAWSLRAVVTTELIPQLVDDRTGIHQVAFFQLLTHVVGMASASPWMVRIFLCQLLIELLDADPQAPTKMLKKGRVAKPLMDAVRCLAAGRQLAADTTEEDPERIRQCRQYLELLATLNSFQEFENLTGLIKG